MDKELFELCKEVYRRTKWGLWDLESKPVDSGCTCGHVDTMKLYTSDYLLAKLPMHIRDYQLRMILPFTTDWRFDYYDANYKGDGRMKISQNNDVIGVADTPLKALLKLTIALHNSGELK